MTIEIRAFTKEMIPGAAELLAQRHRRNRQRLPFLPPRFEQKADAEAALQSLLKRKTTAGYAAVRGDKIVAYLLGDNTVEPWGRCGWVRLPGSALAEGEPITTLEDLYVFLGDDWTRSGVFIHHFYLSAADRGIIDAWFGLDFGKERIDAVLDLREIDFPAVQAPAGIEIRRAGADDAAALGGLSHIIFRELAKAPYWHPTPPEVWPDLVEGWSELATEPGVLVWLGLKNEIVVGTIGFWPEEEGPEAMGVSPGTIELAIAATREEARGRGVATALTWTGLAHSRDSGYDYCYTNWISPNLAASRFWPRFGFQEVAYRLTRNINPKIAWTR